MYERNRPSRDNTAGWASTIAFGAILWATLIGILGSVFGRSSESIPNHNRSDASYENAARLVPNGLETIGRGRSSPDAGAP